ncbi:hypothetical protein KO495_05900 [Colwellia sp. D2M02]|uniref:hypothetical protein n=1 Tax=Colwellia sp. D2M02 TaxID=2841562 RepID=UPI001C0A383F|nr:hypothetical protein [Colwellia sp. D2M02]MBU2892855.1 hypothetical protein [Colwellia sp. D2M02]
MATLSWKEIKQKTRPHNNPLNENSSEVSNLENEIEKKFKEKEHSARSWLTTTFILGLFILIILAGFYVVYYNENVLAISLKLKESNIDLDTASLKFLSFDSIFSLIFNSFGTPLGFIIGYYFKEKVTK